MHSSCSQNALVGFPCHRAAQSDLVKSTLVVDKERKKARLSWYHPDDTVRYLVHRLLTQRATHLSAGDIVACLNRSDVALWLHHVVVSCPT